jgi:hypothetical protein
MSQPPPIPAPWLAGVPSLPDELLARLERTRPTAEDLAEARRTIAKLRLMIRRARTAFERSQDAAIVPEPVWEP